MDRGSCDSPTFGTRPSWARWTCGGFSSGSRPSDASQRARSIRHTPRCCFSIATFSASRPGVRPPCRARRRGAPPDVLAPVEASRLLAAVVPAHRLAVSLLYGAGLRLTECLTLRVNDVDVVRRRIHVREGKGGKGRFTVLPSALREAIAEQIDGVRRQHGRDVQRGGGYVVLPGAFDRKSPNANRDWRGPGCFRQVASTWIVRPASVVGTMCSIRRFSGRWPTRRAVRVWRSASLLTPCGTRSQHSCCEMAMTFGRCRSCSGIAMCRRR